VDEHVLNEVFDVAVTASDAECEACDIETVTFIQGAERNPIALGSALDHFVRVRRGRGGPARRLVGTRERERGCH
jgi:hypothetical protein